MTDYGHAERSARSHPVTSPFPLLDKDHHRHFHACAVQWTAHQFVNGVTAAQYAKEALGYSLARRSWTKHFVEVIDREAEEQMRLWRDVLGNPFRPVSAVPSWRTSTVLALAEGIYADRAFDRMPILADALQDAGCEDEAVLTHCRGDSVHVRGCWVVDLILGKS